MRDTLAFQRLTEGQRHALRTDGFGLINAVAGSGKTTQLVALTLKALLDDHDLTLDKLAIITFTRKAGAELRGRLRQAMEKESAHCPERAAFWAERLAQLPAAPIGTIDALVQQILRRMATEGSDTLPLDPAFAVHDEARTSLLIHRALAQVLENPDETLMAHLDTLHRQHDRRGMETICTTFLTQGGDGERAIGAIAALQGEGFNDANSVDLLLPSHWVEWQNQWATMEPTINGKLQNSASELAGRTTQGPRAICTFAQNYNVEANTAFSRFGALTRLLFNNNGQPRTQGLQDRTGPYSPTLAQLQNDLAPLLALQKQMPAHDRERQFSDNHPLIRAWHKAWGLLLEAVDTRFALLYTRDNSYPFFLLGRLLLRELQVQSAEKIRLLGVDYARVMVDEFQDNTQQQWEIACRLAGGDPLYPDTWKKITLVGDPEQAIYHWRGSNPRLMTLVREQYQASAPAPTPTWYDCLPVAPGHRASNQEERIGLGQLNQNYRTAPATLAAIELASARSMAQVGLPHVTLLAGQPDLTNPEVAAHVAKRDAQAETLLLLPPDEKPDAPAVAGAPEGVDSGDAEGEGDENAAPSRDKFNTVALRMLAAELRRQNAKGIAWKDMMVLAHSFRALLDPLQDALLAEGVPCRALVRDSLWQRQEVSDVVNLARCLSDAADGPALLAVLQGPAGRLSPSEILLLGMVGSPVETPRPNLEAGLRWAGNNAEPPPGPALKAWKQLPALRQERLRLVARQVAGKTGWRALVDRMPHHQLLRLVLRESGGWQALAAWHARPGASADAFDRAARGLDHALDRICEIESQGPLTLCEMAQLLGELMEGNIHEKVDAELGPGEDLVRLMTVHTSKGLEARVIGLLVPMVGKGGTQPRSALQVVLDRQYFAHYDNDRQAHLLGLPLFAYPNHAVDGAFAGGEEDNAPRHQSLFALARQTDILLQLQETVRLFHVAITRSEAVLLVVGSRPWVEPDPSYRLWPQLFCQESWPEEFHRTHLPPVPDQAAVERPAIGPFVPVPVAGAAQHASLSAAKVEKLLEARTDESLTQLIDLAKLGLQFRVGEIPAGWVEGRVLQPQEGSQGAVVGTLVHRGFEMGDALPAEATPRLRLLENMARGLLEESHPGEEEEALEGRGLQARSIAQTAQGILAVIHTPEGAGILALLQKPGMAEVDYSLRLDDWLIRGRFDRLLDDNTIVDWKTDNQPIVEVVAKYQPQMRLYALALWISRGRPAETMRVDLAMTHHRHVEPLVFTPHKLETFESTLRGVLAGELQPADL